VQELILAGDRAAAADAVPHQVADAFVVQGGAEECLARASEYAAAGVDLPVLFPMPADGDWGYEKTIAAMAGKIT
jgi:5,10-methylenetetrahydromethanopterin reductase